MTVTISGTSGITLPSGSTAVGTTDSQTVSNKVLSADTWTSPAGSTVSSGTAVVSTSGTSIDFTGIPSWVKRITVMLNGVSLSSTANIRLQLGVSGSPETTGYVGAEGRINNTPTAGYLASSVSGFDNYVSGAARIVYGTFIFTNISGNIWIAAWQTFNDAGLASYGSGSKSLAGTLNMVRVTTTSTDTFDAGSINILWE